MSCIDDVPESKQSKIFANTQNVSKTEGKELIEKMHSAVYKILSAAMRLSFNNEVKKRTVLASQERNKKTEDSCMHTPGSLNAVCVRKNWRAPLSLDSTFAVA